MNSSKHLKTPGPRIRNNFLTTYRNDYRPLSERPLQFDQVNPRPRPKPEPAVITPPKIDSDTWAVFRRYCYTTTNSAYGSSTFAQKGKSLVASLLEAKKGLQGDAGTSGSVLPTLGASSLGTTRLQGPSLKPMDVKHASSSSSSPSIAPSPPAVPKPPSHSLHPTSSPPSGFPAPAASKPAGGLRSAPKEAWTHRVAADKENVPVDVKDATRESKGQLPCIGGGEGSVLEQQQAEEKAKQKVEGHQEKAPGCDEDYISSLCKAARLEHVLRHHLAPVSMITNNDAQSGDTTTCKKALPKTIGQKENIIPWPPPKQHKCRAWKTEYSDNYDFVTQTFAPRIPRGSTLPKAHPRPCVYYAVPMGKTLLSEYQASYTGKLTRPKICPTYMRKAAQ